MQANTLESVGLISVVFVVTLITTHFLARSAPALGLLAEPGEHRLHTRVTPMVGGIAIYFGLLLGLLLVDHSFSVLMPSLFLLCIVGALDDRFTLPSWSRFLAQGVAAYLMMRFTNVALIDLGSLFSVDSAVLMSGPWSKLMTIFACIGVINAINMSDGLDGLAGSLVLIVLFSLLVLGHPALGLILVAASAVAGFLFWNLRVGRTHAKVFMGDAGSMMLGLLLAYLLIQSSQLDNGILPVTALWLLALPLIDAVAVLIVRPLRGRSPFSADRIHYHHQLLDRGLSVNTVLLAAIALQLLFVAIGVVLLNNEVDEHIQLALFLSVFAAYLARLYRFSGKTQKTESLG